MLITGIINHNASLKGSGKKFGRIGTNILACLNYWIISAEKFEWHVNTRTKSSWIDQNDLGWKKIIHRNGHPMNGQSRLPARQKLSMINKIAPKVIAISAMLNAGKYLS